MHTFKSTLMKIKTTYPPKKGKFKQLQFLDRQSHRSLVDHCCNTGGEIVFCYLIFWLFLARSCVCRFTIITTGSFWPEDFSLGQQLGHSLFSVQSFLQKFLQQSTKELLVAWHNLESHLEFWFLTLLIYCILIPRLIMTKKINSMSRF